MISGSLLFSTKILQEQVILFFSEKRTTKISGKNKKNEKITHCHSPTSLFLEQLSVSFPKIFNLIKFSKFKRGVFGVFQAAIKTHFIDW